jgi:hypothetical protein
MSQPLPKYATAARFERSAVDMAVDRPILERSEVVLACAHVLHTNGQSTHETVQAAERLGTQLGLRTTMIAHWEELELWAADGTGSPSFFRARQSYCRYYSNANFDLLRATIADAMTAIAIILAMSFGVVAPKMIIDRLGGGSTPTPVVI